MVPRRRKPRGRLVPPEPGPGDPWRRMDPSSEYLILALPLGGLGVWAALERARLHRRSLAAEGWQLVLVRPSPHGDGSTSCTSGPTPIRGQGRPAGGHGGPGSPGARPAGGDPGPA